MRVNPNPVESSDQGPRSPATHDEFIVLIPPFLLAQQLHRMQLPHLFLKAHDVESGRDGISRRSALRGVMTNALRKIALQVTIPVLCGLIVLNTYLVAKNLKLIEQSIAHRVEAAQAQADISTLRADIRDLERGQLAYLISGDAADLQPYNDAQGRLPVHFAALRSRVAASPRDRSLETQLEPLLQSQIAKMQETIRLREHGYRHRAFLILDSSHGKQLMDQARATLDTLAAAQTSNVSRYDRQVSESLGKAIKESALASGVLLVVTVVAFLALNRYRKRLEIESAQRSEELHATRLQLEQFTSGIFQDFRALAGQTRSYAISLLDVYGGFLPRQAQEKAECIESGAGQMLRLLDDLSGTAVPEVKLEPVETTPVHSMSA
jgi:CHASE3 domain sensor protein